MIELREVTKIFNRGRPNEYTALNGLSLAIGEGSTTVFRGPSGSGKTTALSIIGCMSRPTSGRVFVNGREITSLPERFLTAIRRRTFGFIFQQFNLIKGVSALENVMIPAYPTGERQGTIKKRALGLLDLFGLQERASAKVEWLSGGETQRIAIARALVNNPSIIIADEPTAHLDTALSREFMAIMGQLNTEGKTIIIASHDPLVYSTCGPDAVVSMRDGMLQREEMTQ
jgi:putative ABC transport system ATP-binding protein